MHSYIKDFKIANILHINILSICWGLLKKKRHSCKYPWLIFVV